jgi:hypothetical protein
MFVVIIGDPNTGFAALGPYGQTHEGADFQDLVKRAQLALWHRYDDNGWWTPRLKPDLGFDPEGRIVVMLGFGEGWEFVGPFKDAESAAAWMAANAPRGVMVDLHAPAEFAELAA